MTRIDAAATSITGRQMEDPNFKPDTDSSTLAVLEMSEGAMRSVS